MVDKWITHKFGGTSLANADAYRSVSAILSDGGDHRLAVIVSAPAGMTDRLIALVDGAASRADTIEADLNSVRDHQAALISETVGVSDATSLIDLLEKDLGDVGDVLRGARVVGNATRDAVDLVSGLGEVWSARLLAAVLRGRGAQAYAMDARAVLVVDDTQPTPVVDWKASGKNLSRWLSAHPAGTVVISGFVASQATGRPTTLGRNGSDYSASIFGSLLHSDEVVIWTDVDGILSADPRLVPQAQVVPELSYDEAMELAYFGATVLHPATMTPAVRAGIPVTIRNTFNPEAPGTRIHPGARADHPVKGFASIGDMALLNLEGTGMVGVPGVSERLFGALRVAGVSVVMISQGSSEHSICFAIPQTEARRAREAIERAFAAEKLHGLVQDLQMTGDCTILAAVGDNMSGTPGIAARFFGALARVGVNVRAIAQGSSERNISVVIATHDATRALRAVHASFYLSRQTISIGVIGIGHVGSAFLDQLRNRRDWLRTEFAIDLRVRALASSSVMVIDDDGIDLDTWRGVLEEAEEPFDKERFVEMVDNESIPHSVIVDCTASDDIAAEYLGWLSRGIHLVTPNKKANSGSMQYYRELQGASRRADAHYLYETTVGAALPIVQTLRDLVQTGDTVRRIEGVFSGTLSFLFNNFDGRAPFSKILAAARERGFTEADPREDLSGMDVARKVVILAREMGMELGVDDLQIEGLIPEGLESGSVEDFMASLEEHDRSMAALFEDARVKDEVLRFVGVIDPVAGCSVALRRYEADHPFARIRMTDNIVQFQTDRYNENPLVIQGPGAGPEVTAGGVFADLLRLTGYLGAVLI